MIIAISAGHYPERPGACFGNFCEYSEANRWAINITDHLIRAGLDARLVPTGVLKNKVAFINDIDADIAVEIHFNSAKDSNGKHIGKGCEALYHPESQKGAYLASTLLDAMEDLFKPSRGIKEGWYRMDRNKGVDFFLAKTRCPSAIIEPEFIHCTANIAENREAACLAIAESLIRIEGEL